LLVQDCAPLQTASNQHTPTPLPLFSFAHGSTNSASFAEFAARCFVDVSISGLNERGALEIRSAGRGISGSLRPFDSYLFNFFQQKVIPPCFSVCLWLVKGFDPNRARESLGKVLRENFPFALGKASRDANGSWSIEGSDVGFAWTEVEAQEQRLSDFVGVPHHKWPSHKFVDFLNATAENVRIFNVKVVRLEDGFSVALGVHHNVLDGRGMFDVVAEWTRVYKGMQPQQLDKVVFGTCASEHGPASEAFGFGLVPKVYDYANLPKMHTIRVHFSSEALQQMRGEGAFTKNDVVCGAIWAASIHCRKIDSSSLFVVVDVRDRLKLGKDFGSWYAGNCCVYAEARCDADVSTKSLSEMGSIVKQAVAAVAEPDVCSSMRWIATQPNRAKIVSPGMRVALSSSIVISNWTRFDLYSVGPFDEVLFAGPGMPTEFRGMDGIAILTDDGRNGVFAFVSLLESQTEEFLQHHLIKTHSTVA
jgi:hypothetical protein